MADNQIQALTAEDLGLSQAFYSVPAFAKQFGRDRTWAFELIRSKKISSVRMNNRTYITRNDIVELANANYSAANLARAA